MPPDRTPPSNDVTNTSPPLGAGVDLEVRPSLLGEEVDVIPAPFSQQGLLMVIYSWLLESQ